LTVVAVGPLATAGCHVRTFVDDPAFARAAILGDSALCVGCRRCELTCSAIHHAGLVWPERARLTVDGRAEERRFVDGLWFADACHECPATLGRDGEEAPPPCIEACPTGALHVASFEGEGGEAGRLRLRVVEAARCDGCGDCVPACPYGVVVVDRETELAVVCDLCAGRAGGPACVAGCPSSALRYYEPWRHLPARPFPWEGNE
jgi:Fe-S-cluster-containing hydrogenase component 2